MTKAVNKTEKRKYEHELKDENLRDELYKLLYDKVYEVAKNN
ncbi:MAG: hypothetical protein QM734_04170 [Cyclobacteriaceae bacterium]